MPGDVAPVAQALHTVLKPLGFRKSRARWNRASGPFIDVIDIQKAQITDNFTVNCGVFDPRAYTLVWDKRPAKFISEVDCAVRARIGDLIDGHDLWWALENGTVRQAVVDDVVSKVVDYVLPFLDRMHSLEAMIMFLAGRHVDRYALCPEALYLAILNWQSGKEDDAKALLQDFVKRGRGWPERAREVLQRLAQS